MNKKCSDVGGQALIEGVMMKGNDKIAIAVRKSDGSITIDKKADKPMTKRFKVLGLPFIRGVVALIDAMVVGVSAISYSAEFFEEGASEDKFDRFFKKVFKDKAEGVLIGLSIVMAIGMAIGLFILMPAFLAELAKGFTSNRIVLNIIEGAIRITAFVSYILIIGRMRDIRRVFEYHGAEHKSIYCYESGKELTVENARGFSTLHPRCGTNFMLLVMVIAILIFSLFTWSNPLEKALIRLALLPLISGISYEVLKLAAKSDNIIFRAIRYPGLMLQKLTTKEPDDAQLEVALSALKSVLADEA